MRQPADPPSWGAREWAMLAAACMFGVSTGLTMLEPAAHTPARIAASVLPLWLVGTMVVLRVTPRHFVTLLTTMGMAAAVLTEAAMLTRRWPAPVHTRVAAAIGVATFGIILFERWWRERRAAIAD